MITVSALVASLVMGLALAFSLVALWVAITASGVASFRIALWRLHDDLVDCLMTGEVQDVDGALRLRDSVRRTIAQASRFSVTSIFGTYLILRFTGASRLLGEISDESYVVGEATSDDACLNGFSQRYIDLASHYVYRTTVLGRLGIVFVPLAFAAWRVAHHTTKGRFVDDAEELAERPVATEVTFEDLARRLRFAGNDNQSMVARPI